MKKIFLCALAAAALTTACNKAEVIDVVGTPAIQFENAFVGNATRAAEDPSYSGTKELTELSLYGFMNTTSGVVFNNERLAKDITNTELTQAWKYANTQYWTPGNTYYFAAVAPFVKDGGDVALDFSQANEYGAGVISFTQPVDAGSVDVLYDAKKVECKEGQTMNPVAFTMNHMLSKVKFSFTNGFGNDNAYITVKNIKMTAPASGYITVAQADWWSTNCWELTGGQTTLEFGDMETAKLAIKEKTESEKERLTIPTGADQSYNVTFDVELYYGDQLAYSNTLETVIKGAELKIGRAYNFHATIDATNIVPGEGDDDKLKPIEFTVEVKGWEDGKGYDGGIINTGSLSVLEEGYSVAADKVGTLEASSVTSSTVAVAGTFDGAGNTLTITEGTADYVSDGNFKLIALNGENVTVKNMVIDGNNASAEVGGTTYGVRNIVIDAAGTYTIDNVKSINATYPLHVRTTAEVELIVKNSTMEGWLSYNAGTTASFENVAFTTGTYGRFRPYGTTTLTNCSFDAGYVIDLSRLAAGEKVTFVNCTYNGVALAAANITTVDGEKTIAGTYEIK
ncbi:MAG: fimbrillin family protein [Bacteroidales bacterium]|nr:fimbrillin family protein [Bacteroidales bacterium]